MLFLYLAQNVFLHVLPVIPDQVLTQFLLYFVERCVLGVGHLLADGNPFFVYDYQHLFRFGHFQAHNLHHLPEYIPVYLFEGWPLAPVAHAAEIALALGVHVEVCSDVEVEEIYGDLEDLVLINFHHHEKIPETQLAYFDSLLTSSHSFVQPLILILEKLRIKVSDSPCQHLEYISIFLPHRVQKLLHLVVLIRQGNQLIQFLSHPLQHHEVFIPLRLVVGVDG